MPVVQRRRPPAPVLPRGSPGRPVLLATLDVPFDHDAVVFAVDSAVEMGTRLIVANVVERPPLPLSAIMGYDDLPYPHVMAESLVEPWLVDTAHEWEWYVLRGDGHQLDPDSD